MYFGEFFHQLDDNGRFRIPAPFKNELGSTFYLSKGLEFDSVLLLDADENSYSEDVINAKLLYVGVTRAMHTLDIYYVKELTKWLK